MNGIFLRAKGRALTFIAAEFGVTRMWYEKIPWAGDRWFRSRVVATMKSVLNRGTKAHIGAMPIGVQ